MTPSQWHDDVRNRDAGHDEMQIAVFDYLRGKHADLKDAIGFEVPIVSRGQIIAWGDIMMVLPRSGRVPEYLVIWEIKPKIYSVGAVVRQCIALERAASVARTDAEIRIIPVVQAGDPKLSALRHVFYAQAWDGRHLAWKQECLT